MWGELYTWEVTLLGYTPSLREVKVGTSNTTPLIKSRDVDAFM